MVRYTRKGLLKGEGNMGFLTGKTAIITGAGRAVLSLSLIHILVGNKGID